ncbi:phosphotransferase enzyme family-domain-containing protein [Bombardia bombarda]|uniref:Phosphotransferase enzyme family-domain-containing protein n=1 Tax=Bombardia bombarda TaxID=252184 RepID=A0AA39WUM9_9PEZI|nr:phosphotransferase enzyme family-domain-containing protein [Bombardia bombarda]
MRDRIVQARVHKNRQDFIESINEDDICRLASSYHGGDPCSFFKPPDRGSYNSCYFVEFGGSAGIGIGRSRGDDVTGSNGSSDGFNNSKKRGGDRWVVRVPLSPYLAMPAYDKLESEVAVMQLIAAKTTIPIPPLHAYSLAREKGPYGVASFMILGYVEGRSLNDVPFKSITKAQELNLHTQLADIFIQLRRLEFPAIGRLAPSADGKGGVEVRKAPISNAINLQEIEGLHPLRVMADYADYEDGSLASANGYVAMLIQLAHNAFKMGRNNVYSEADGSDSLYHIDQFETFVERRWLKSELDLGPFVLAHGDFRKYNLMVDDDLDIVAVLDWEWSLVVPLQFFSPPTWLTNQPVSALTLEFPYIEYVEKLDEFRDIVRERELARYGNELLSKEWAHVHENGGVMVSSALESWTDIDFVSGWYLNRLLHPSKLLATRRRGAAITAAQLGDERRRNLDSRIQQFMKQDPSRAELVARKVADYLAYRTERKALGVEDSEDEDQEKEEEDRYCQV